MEERIAQLERDVKSLQECNDAAHKEIANVKAQFNDEFLPLLHRELIRLFDLYNGLHDGQAALDQRTIGSFFMGKRP